MLFPTTGTFQKERIESYTKYNFIRNSAGFSTHLTVTGIPLQIFFKVFSKLRLHLNASKNSDLDIKVI